LHFSHIFRTLGRTFMTALLLPSEADRLRLRTVHPVPRLSIPAAGTATRFGAEEGVYQAC